MVSADTFGRENGRLQYQVQRLGLLLLMSVAMAVPAEDGISLPEVALVIPGFFTSGDLVTVVVLGSGLSGTKDVQLEHFFGSTSALSFEVESDVSVIADFNVSAIFSGMVDLVVMTEEGEARLVDAIEVRDGGEGEMPTCGGGGGIPTCEGGGGGGDGGTGLDSGGFGGGMDLLPSSLFCTVSDGNVEGAPGIEGATVSLGAGTNVASEYRAGIYVFSLVAPGQHEIEA